MAKRLAFPALSCIHYADGACLYEERINPGLHTEWLCSELQRFSDAYESIEERADAFGIGDGKHFAALVLERFSAMPSMGEICPDFVAAPLEEKGSELRQEPQENVGFFSLLNSLNIDCLFSLDGLCRKKMPLCAGQCSHYTAR